MCSIRFALLACTVFALAACNETPAPAPDVTETYFAPALDIDLNLMTKTASGLYYQDAAIGTGTAAATGDSVFVYYSGYLTTGTKFDGHTSGASVGLKLGTNLIEGWNEGLVGMRVGGTRRLVVPPNLGYGASPNGSIPANSILVFTVELKNVKKATQ